MGGASAAAASAVMCAVVSLSWVAADPAQAVGPGGDGRAPGRRRRRREPARWAVPSARRGARWAVPSARRGARWAVRRQGGGRTVGGTVGDVGSTVGGTVARRGARWVARSTMRPTPRACATHIKRRRLPRRHRTARRRLRAGRTRAGDAVPQARLPHRRRMQRRRPRPGRGRRRSATERTPATSLQRRSQLHGDSILASMRPDWRHSFAAIERGERSGVALQTSLDDESCRSGSLAVRDLRRCAFASTLIPQLGGPSSALLLMSLAMIGAGLALVARRRRVTPVGPAMG